MRHRKKTVKLGRTAEHRNALLANQICSLIEHHRIRTTLAKAKAVRPLAERMVTLGKKGDLHSRRIAISYLRDSGKVKLLFEKIAPAAANREGGYTRIIKLGRRNSDSAPMAYIEWVDLSVEEDDSLEVPAPEEKSAKKATTKKATKAAKDSEPSAKKPKKTQPAAKSKDSKAEQPEAKKDSEASEKSTDEESSDKK